MDRIQIIAKIERNILRVPESGCWIWMAGRTTAGYGIISVGDYTQKYAHRVSWEVHCGDLPTGTYVLHRCDVPCCVNPHHLFLGDNAANMADMKSKGRQARSIALPQTKLTDDEVRDVLSSPEMGRALAAKYAVSESLISMIRSRQRRSHVSA